MIEELLTLFTSESIIILILDMTDELIIVYLRTFRHCCYRFECDSALELVILYVCKMMSCEKQISSLFHTEAVKLEDFDREDDMLIREQLILNILIEFEVQVIVSHWNWFGSVGPKASTHCFFRFDHFPCNVRLVLLCNFNHIILRI